MVRICEGGVGDIGGRCIILPPTVDDIPSQQLERMQKTKEKIRLNVNKDVWKRGYARTYE